jgi:hypothetical protein
MRIRLILGGGRREHGLDPALRLRLWNTINLAARLGACKQYKVPVLIGETTFGLIRDDIAAREVDVIRVVGKAKPVAVYEIIGEKSGLAPEETERLKLYEEAREAYKRREWQRAAGLFGKIEGDALAALYRERCDNLSTSPPAADWDGLPSQEQIGEKEWSLNSRASGARPVSEPPPSEIRRPTRVLCSSHRPATSSSSTPAPGSCGWERG